VKLPVIRTALGSDVESSALDRPATAAAAGVLSRRGLLRTTWGAAALATVTTVGISVPWLRQVSVLGVRSGDGPQGVPVNKSAAAAGVLATATSAAYRLTVRAGDRSASFSLAELRAMPQTTASLPIACVEGWSAGATWTGVAVRDLLDRVGAPSGRDVRVSSLQATGPYRVTTLPGNFADDRRTLVALDLGGEPLSIDHGFPCRLIAPDRPGVLQTKWLASLEVAS
jgi:DMSO/TMAO reductase YedYZ molybdopterin-dependent catalytic subunit